MPANLLEQWTRLRHRLNVDDELVGPRLVIGFEVLFRVRNHQMNVDRQFRIAANCFDDRQPVGQIGDEMAVHYVQMQGSGPSRLDTADLVGQMAEVTEQQRR